MGSLSTIFAALSEDVVAALAAASYPPLTPDASGNAGAILVGTAALFEQVSAPRIIFEPVSSKFAAAWYASPSATLDTLERQHEGALRAIASDNISFNVRCWGNAGTGIPVDDYDVTRALYHQVRASLNKLMEGSYAIEEAGKWTAVTNINRSGLEFVFGVTFFTPILDTLIPYDRNVLYAPDDVSVVGTDHLVNPAGIGGSEAGCT